MFFIPKLFAANLDCSDFNDLSGCLLVPQKLTSKKLFIYLRGHFEGKSPPHPSSLSDRKRSLEEAVKTYKLAMLSEQVGMPILFSSVANIYFTKAKVRAIMREYNLEEIALASHSGSYTALNKELDLLSSVKEVFLLDNFYGTEAFALELGELIQESGSLCRGFLTAHNKQRYESRYKKVINCLVEKNAKFDHISSVGVCLPLYLSNKTCLSI